MKKAAPEWETPPFTHAVADRILSVNFLKLSVNHLFIPMGR